MAGLLRPQSAYSANLCRARRRKSFPLRQMRIRGGELAIWGAVMHARRKVRLPPIFSAATRSFLSPTFEARILFWAGGAGARR